VIGAGGMRATTVIQVSQRELNRPLIPSAAQWATRLQAMDALLALTSRTAALREARKNYAGGPEAELQDSFETLQPASQVRRVPLA
jgi:hypothetical protein